mgnify:CR=1 FL=1
MKPNQNQNATELKPKTMCKNKYLSESDIENIFNEYVKDVKDNPRMRVEYVGRDGQRVETPIERPLTMAGFYSFGYSKGVTLHHYFDNPEGAYDEYRGITTRIRQRVRAEQLDGGLTNQYNSNLTARLNSLTDKQQVEHTTPPPLFPDVE